MSMRMGIDTDQQENVESTSMAVLPTSMVIRLNYLMAFLVLTYPSRMVPLQT
jgi:hypothetical protein